MKQMTNGCCRLLLGITFIYAAIIKIGEPQAFADSIASYGLLPDSCINIVALGLPLFECAGAVLLCGGSHSRIGLLSMIGILTFFLVAMLSAVIRGLPVDCGCFGALSPLEARPSIAILRDLGLLLCAIYAYGFYIRSETGASQQGASTANRE